jgi:predicted cupin superfamily sugar epimerase
MKNADYWIDKLALETYPEGGYFKEILRSPETIETPPERYPGPRCFYTSIYYLLKSGQVNAMHRLKSDELWYYHAGNAMTVHVIYPDGRYTPLGLGPDLDAGQSLQVLAPAGTWFGASVDEPDAYALVGCMVAPGFEFEDYELGDRADLLARFPRHTAIITRLTQPGAGYDKPST